MPPIYSITLPYGGDDVRFTVSVYTRSPCITGLNCNFDLSAAFAGTGGSANCVSCLIAVGVALV